MQYKLISTSLLLSTTPCLVSGRTLDSRSISRTPHALYKRAQDWKGFPNPQGAGKGATAHVKAKLASDGLYYVNAAFGDKGTKEYASEKLLVDSVASQS